MSSLTDLQHQIQAALGERPLDLLVRNVRLVDVYREAIVETDLGIAGDRIVSVLPGAARAARATLDAGGQYALPGFIDAHIHIEIGAADARPAGRRGGADRDNHAAGGPDGSGERGRL